MNYQDEIESYVPRSRKEKIEKEQIQSYCKEYADRILLRENESVHMTASGLIMNPELNKVLMVYHNIYQSYSWSGGHSDGEPDLWGTALREAEEETGLKHLSWLNRELLSLDLLAVSAHVKNGREVKAHRHISAAFGFIAEETEATRPNLRENTEVRWLPVDSMEDWCREPHMIPIYKKIIDRMKTMKKYRVLGEISAPLLQWYDSHARILPWREDTDPYRVWVSEIMLQQTRVEAVIPYFERFTEQLPGIASLANAPEDLLLKLWEGLGYYNRVRNMKKAAQIMMKDYGGRFPETAENIAALPGIGEYTAGAIASISFERPMPAVDGNVLRVVSRLTENWEDITKLSVKKEIAERLKYSYPPRRRGDFTQSLMELGATVCIPHGTPNCAECPLASQCLACRNATMEQLPVKTEKKPRKVEYKTVFLLCCREKTALKKREKKGLLAGLWEFPNVEGTLAEEEAAVYLQEKKLSLLKLEPLPETVHIFSHVEWRMTGFYAECKSMPEEFQWRTLAEIEQETAVPGAFQPFLRKLKESRN